MKSVSAPWAGPDPAGGKSRPGPALAGSDRHQSLNKPDYSLGGPVTSPDGPPPGVSGERAMYPAGGTATLWIAERCGQNTCVGSDPGSGGCWSPPDGTVPPGASAPGLISWPPRDVRGAGTGGLWITGPPGPQGGPRSRGLGHAVMKFSPTGELLMTIGTPGQAGGIPPTSSPRPK